MCRSLALAGQDLIGFLDQRLVNFYPFLANGWDKENHLLVLKNFAVFLKYILETWLSGICGRGRLLGRPMTGSRFSSTIHVDNSLSKTPFLLRAIRRRSARDSPQPSATAWRLKMAYWHTADCHRPACRHIHHELPATDPSLAKSFSYQITSLYRLSVYIDIHLYEYV